MSVAKEFRCRDHGDFIASHPICGELGCDSKHVERVFLTPPGTRSDRTKRTDQGLRKTVEQMNLGNLRSAKAGEASYGGHLANQMLWGDDCQKVLKQPLASVVQSASQPFSAKRNGHEEVIPNGMRLAAQAGITKQVLPPSELTVSSRDRASRQARVDPH